MNVFMHVWMLFIEWGGNVEFTCCKHYVLKVICPVFIRVKWYWVSNTLIGYERVLS